MCHVGESGQFRLDSLPSDKGEYTVQFTITFIADSGAVVATATVQAPAYLDACGLGWSNIPEGATDFQVAEVEAEAS